MIGEWVSKNLAPHTLYDSSIFDRFHEIGINSAKNTNDTIVLTFKDKSIKVQLINWDQIFTSLIDNGRPFVLIDPDHIGEPLQRDGYHIVNKEQSNDLIRLGYGWLQSDEKSKMMKLINGNTIASAICHLGVCRRTTNRHYSIIHCSFKI